jgi:rare lipoprotein A
MNALTFIAAGIASWYSLPGNTMANGHRFNPGAHVCAMRSEPFGTKILITNDENGNESWCIVSDRGPYVRGRIIDVSPIVRDELGFGGLTRVRLYENSKGRPSR